MALHSYIDIDVSSLPYSQLIIIENKQYNFTFFYNEVSRQFTVDIADANNNIIRAGEVLVLNQPLWRRVVDYRLPMVSLIPMDESRQETDITLGNLGKTVKLIIDDIGVAK